MGEKIIEKKEGSKITYRKTEEGEFERDVSVDRIYNLNRGYDHNEDKLNNVGANIIRIKG